ncbi:MAG: DUF2083 domain-containing protein [Myxococcales bacterium]|nr:DUF2083 domain-containing protein [Myxococcales bacterium]
MSEAKPLGGRVRALRRRAGLTQAELAERLGISPSYLNLIEHDRRRLTAELLIALAQQFDVDLATFADDTEALTRALRADFADPIFDEYHLKNHDIVELVTASPNGARAVAALFRAWRAAQDDLQSVAALLGFEGDGEEDALGRQRLPAEEVSDALQTAGNHFPELETAAEALAATLGPRDRASALITHLTAGGVDVRVETIGAMSGALRHYDPRGRVLRLSEALPPESLTFQLAHQIALLQHGSKIDALVEQAALSTATARSLYRVALANYFAGAVMMPYARFHQAAVAEKYDIELLSHRFHAGFEQVAHRLTTLRRKGAEGVPFHFVRVDIAGNISKRFSASGIRFARFAGACPRWNVHSAFLTPGRICAQISEMADGATYFCIARTVERGGGGHRDPRTMMAVGLGCRLEFAAKLVYSEGLQLDARPVPVDVTCRLCPRMDCAQRAMPPLNAPLRVDENLRGLSFYAPVESPPSGS